MKGGVIVVALIIAGAVLSMAVMIKYASEIKVEDRQRLRDDPAQIMFQFTRPMGVISLNQNTSLAISRRFPYIAAITRNYSYTWSFACFASMILVKWVVTAAHCRKYAATHKVLLYHDFVRNHSHTYPILFWKVHEDYDSYTPGSQYDIAIAKLNLQEVQPTAMKSSYIEEGPPTLALEASVWKTVSTMDKKLFLTNTLESFAVSIAPNNKCFETYGVTLDESLFCLDMSAYREDCFVHEFGPIYSGDRIVGVVTMQPRDCDVKYAIFTNVSFYTNWILKSSKTTYYG